MAAWDFSDEKYFVDGLGSFCRAPQKLDYLERLRRYRIALDLRADAPPWLPAIKTYVTTLLKVFGPRCEIP